MATDLDFARLADQFMEQVLDALDVIDPDEVDTDLAMGVLTMEFADGTKAIMNRQTAAHQIWLASGVSAWHFEYDTDTGAWLDSKGRGRLEMVLASVLSERLGRPIEI